LYVSLRGCPPAWESNRSNVRYWHKADIGSGAHVCF
jgi:hypothetical protein